MLRKCKNCGNDFQVKRKVQKYCNRRCAQTMSHDMSVEQKHKMSLIATRRHVSGDTSIGWQSRNKSSYAENYFESVFTKEGLTYEREKRIGKWFADFYFDAIKLVVEIDGRQHQDDDRKIKDAEKDAYLTENGFTVIRIKWKGTNNKYEYYRKYVQHILTMFNDATLE